MKLYPSACFLLSLTYAGLVSVLHLTAAPLPTPDDVFDIPVIRADAEATLEHEYLLPPIVTIHGYIPVLQFDLSIQPSQKILPQLLFNQKTLPELDRKRLPRLLLQENIANSSCWRYLVNLADIISDSQQTQLTIKLPKKHSFEVSNMSIFYKTDLKNPWATPPPCQTSAFTIHPDKVLRIDYKGLPFIIGEEMNGLPPLNDLMTQKIIRRTSEETITSHNLLYLNSSTVDFRREAALTPRGELEIAVRSFYKQSHNSLEGYRFIVDANLLDGANYEFRYGNWHAYNSVKGKFDFSRHGPANRIFYHPKSRNIYTYIRYLFISKGDMKLVFDFGPQGMSPMYPVTNFNLAPCAVSFVYLLNGKLVFGLTKASDPGRFSNLVRIYASDYDYYYRHNTPVYDYYVGPFLENLGYRISFSSIKETTRRNRQLPSYPPLSRNYQMPFQSARTTTDRNAILPYWKKLPKSAGHFHSGPYFPNAAGLSIPRGTATYTLPMDPGIYTCSIITGSWKQPTGPFDIFCNGETVVKKLTVSQGSFRQIFFSAYPKSPETHLNLTFKGKGINLNQFIAQPAIAEQEDFIWRRSFWNVPDLPGFGQSANHFDIISPRKPAPVILGTGLSPEIRPTAMRKSLQQTCLPPPFPATSLTESWVWNINLCHGYRPGSEFGFMDETNLRERCEKLKHLGYNTIIEDGLFWYNVHPEASKLEHLRYQKQANALIHQLGLKVIRHADGPGFNTADHGVSEIASFIDAMPVDAGTLKSSNGIGCISNPKLKHRIFHLLERYVRETDCDGLMIDECVLPWAPNPRCFCAYCREKFTRDTGCTLPMPDEARDFLTSNSPIYARWRHWQQLQTGVFYHELKEHLKTIKPNIIITNYGLDFQLHQGRTQTLAPYVDLIGTEGHYLSLMHNYRNQHANRKLIAAYGETTQHPTFYWAYKDWGITNETLTRYVYWAFHSLTRTGIIDTKDHMNGDASFALWKHKLDFRHQQTLADIAIFHRPDYRNLPKPYPIAESLGLSQVLTDLHVPHTFITKLDLQHLKPFKLIFLGHCTTMSDVEVAVLKDYVRMGGKLVLTSPVGILDELYNPTSCNRLSSLTGVEYIIYSKHNHQLTYIYRNQSQNLICDVTPIVNQTAETIASTVQGSPLICRKSYGKGICVATALNLGTTAYEDLLQCGQPLPPQNASAVAIPLQQLLDTAAHTSFPLMVENAPKGIVIEASQNLKDHTLSIQLMNMNAGFNTLPGQIPRPKPLQRSSFEPLHRNLLLTLRLPVDKAVAYSPDFPRPQILAFKRLGPNAFRIVLPKHLLKIYTVIRIFPQSP